MQLRDKVILITGASRGIGAAAARAFAAESACVVLAARSTALVEAGARAIEQAGGRALPVTLDVTSDESAQCAVSRILDRHGHIDVLINNAGNGGTLGYLAERSPADTRSMFEVHLFGTERMMRSVLPGMRARGAGRIVNIVSTVGYVPMPGAAAYCGAKAAVIAMTRALEGELQGSGIDLALFSPPHTQTEAGREWPLPLPATFSPEEAARALVNAVRRDRHECLAGGNHTLLWLQRLAPGWANRIMRGIGIQATGTRLSEGG